MTGLELGGPAPDFTLRDQFGQDVSLSSYRDKKAVAILFYPYAFSGVCTGEMAGVRNRLDEFLTFETEVGKGTDFVLRLPLSGPDRAAHPPA